MRWGYLVCLGALPGLGWLPAAAAELVRLEPVVVCASRSELKASEAASSVTIIGREQIERQQVTHVVDLLRDVPGIAVSRAGTFGSQAQVRLRGAESNHVLVLIDGIEANDPASNDEFRWETLTTHQIERIEIVRGPQSALWGSDAVAGVINIITDAASGPPGAGVFLEGGSFETVYGGARLRAAGERHRLDLGAAYLDSAGSNISRTGSEDDGYDNLTLSGSAVYAPRPDLELGLTGRYTDASNEFDAIDFLATGLPTDADRENTNEQLFLQSRARLGMWEERWHHDLRLAWTATENHNYADGRRTDEANADRYGLYYQSSIELAAGPGDAIHGLNLGIDLEREEFTQRGEAGFADPNQDRNMHNSGFAGEYLLRAFDGLTLSAGLRYDDNSDFRNQWSSRLAASFRAVTTGTRLHASYGTGHKAPTFIERYGYFPDLFVGNEALRPEESRGFDLGIEQSLADGELTVGLTYFQSRLNDEINGFAADPETGLFTAINEDGASRRRGIESTLAWSFADAGSLSLSYTFTDAEEPDADGGDRKELRRPRHMAAASVNHGFAAGRGNLNVNVSYTGERDDVFFPPFPQEARRVELESYTLVNLAASYQLTPRLRAYGRIENLMDEDYEDIYGFATPGIGVYAGFRADWGR
jgi:vitamin B12 transporter